MNAVVCSVGKKNIYMSINMYICYMRVTPPARVTKRNDSN